MYTLSVLLALTLYTLDLQNDKTSWPVAKSAYLDRERLVSCMHMAVRVLRNLVS